MWLQILYVFLFRRSWRSFLDQVQREWRFYLRWVSKIEDFIHTPGIHNSNHTSSSRIPSDTRIVYWYSAHSYAAKTPSLGRWEGINPPKPKSPVVSKIKVCLDWEERIYRYTLRCNPHYKGNLSRVTHQLLKSRMVFKRHSRTLKCSNSEGHKVFNIAKPRESYQAYYNFGIKNNKWK